MPRSRGGAPARPSAPSRPQAPAPPPRTTAPQQQTRQMSTAPTQQHQPPPAATQSQGPGLFGRWPVPQLGSSIGHAIGGFFGGGSSQAAAPEQQQQQSAMDYSQNQAMDSGLYNASNAQQQANSGPCAVDVRNFTQCMNQNNGDMNVCGWYMEQLRACQQAAGKY